MTRKSALDPVESSTLIVRETGDSPRNSLIHWVIPAGLTILCAGLFAGASWPALQRSLWVDETMAMSNYPLHGLLALFRPLTLYSQAAPPLFNLIMSGLADFPAAMIRLAFLLIIVVGTIGFVGFSFRSWAASAGSAIGVMAPRFAIHQITELKYYGLEVLGTVVILCWLLTRKPLCPIRGRDFFILAFGMSCGISTIPIAVLAFAYALMLRFCSSERPRHAEVVWGIAFFLFAGAYYEEIKFAVSIQIGTYFDVYELKGAGAVLELLRAIYTAVGLPFIPIGLFALWLTIMDRRSQISRTILVYLLIVAFAFSTLSFAGVYPVTNPRHVLWCVGFCAVVLANGARILMSSFSNDRRLTVIYGAVLVGVFIGALVPICRQIRTPDVFFQPTDNANAVQELLRLPEVDVGLWMEGQPAIEYYSRFYPKLTEKRFFGLLNQASLPLPLKLKTDAFLKLPYSQISEEIESQRDQPGAWGREVVYRALGNYSAATQSLIRSAPQGKDFLLFISHIGSTFIEPPPSSDRPLKRDLSFIRRQALRETLSAADCRFEQIWSGSNVFILRANCPTTRARPSNDESNVK